MQTTEVSVQSEASQKALQVKSVSLSARLKADRHQYVGGFKNIAYLVGYVRHISKTGFLLQMNNSENLMIPIRFAPGKKLPRDFNDRDPLKVYARMIGIKNGDIRRTFLVASRLDRPNVLELPNADAFRAKVHAQSSEDASFKPYGSGNTPSNASNQAMLAGYVTGYSVRESRITEDGSEINGRLLIDIQQLGDPDRIIQVRLYGSRYAAVAARLRIGMALMFHGRIRTDVVPTGEKDPQTGKDIVRHMAYMQIDVPELPTETDILFLDRPEQTPAWVKSLEEQATSRGKRSTSTAPARAAGPTTTETASPKAEPTQATEPTQAPAQTTVQAEDDYV
jgi:hypothetical protein